MDRGVLTLRSELEHHRWLTWVGRYVVRISEVRVEQPAFASELLEVLIRRPLGLVLHVLNSSDLRLRSNVRRGDIDTRLV